MMRKFSKILALVLAFAMVLCPVLTAAAEGEAEVLYSSAILNADIADGKADVTLTVETIEEINAIDFKINLAKGVSFDPEVDTVSINADESGDAASWSVVTNYADGVLSVLAVDGDDMANVAAYLVFNITLTVENASDYDFYLTKIYAVGAGSADADEVIAVFPYADNAQSGVIDVEAARTDCPDYFVTNVCAHANVTTTETPATCTEPGSSVVTCNDCGSVVSETELPATGHNFAIEGEIIAATEEAVGYYGYDIACSVCDALNPAYYAEDGSVRTDVDFAALAADGVIEEIPMLEVPCAPADVWSSDETGHWHDCTCGEQHDFAEHTAGDAVEVERVDAQPGVAGYYVTVVSCTECEYEISRTTTEIPALPVGPTVDDTLKFASVSPGFGSSSLQISFRVNNTVLDSYADMAIVLIPQKYGEDYNLIEKPSEIVIMKKDLAKAGSTRKQYVYTDINLYELGLDVNYMLRAYDAKGEVVAESPVYTTSVASYLKTLAASSSSAVLHTVVADIFIVNDEAAAYFCTEGSDLANATPLTEGYDISAATPSVDSYNNVNEFTSNDSAYGTASTATHQVRTSVQVGKAPFINFRIGDSKKALDLSKLNVNVTYVSEDGNTYTYDYTQADFTWAGKYINVTFDKIGLHDGDKDIVFTVTYDGAEKCTLTYSVESYLGANMSNASLGKIATALVKLGGSFRAYVAS